MNIFTDALFLLVFILCMIYFDIPNINDNNPILHKFYLFSSICMFYFIIQLIKKIKNKCKLDIFAILQESITVSLICILGYSTYIDFTIMESTKEFFLSRDDKLKKIALVALTMVGLFVLIQLTMALFETQKDICS